MMPMKPILRLAIVCLVILCSTACDQVAKGVARDTLSARPSITLLGGMVLLSYAENPGAILGLGSELPLEVRSVLSIAVVSATVIAAIVLSLRSRELTALQLFGLALVAGGGVGNLVDRVFNAGLVVDFMVLRAGPLSTGIFNLADVAVFGGVGLLLFEGVRAELGRRKTGVKELG